MRETAQALRAEGRDEEALEYVLSALSAVLKTSRELELLVAKLRRAGRSRSERIDPGQLALLFEQFADELGPEAVEAPDVEAEAMADAELEREIKGAQELRGPKPRGPSRSWRTRDVERMAHTVEVEPEGRTCERCEGPKKKIGEDVSRVLAYEPGRFVEHEYRLDKWACGRCKRGVTTAPGPVKVIAQSAADASLLADVVVSKYVDHTPLHRLHRIYDRSGATIPVSTLSDWVGAVAERVEPLVERIRARILSDAYVVRTDATGLRVLDPKSPENVQRGTIWCVVGDDSDVAFHYTRTGEGETGPWSFLAGRTGYVQADAASVFDRLFDGQAASATEVGCWAHARRKFHALIDTDCRVAYPLQLIRRMYRVEYLGDLKELSGEGRAALRRKRDRPTLDNLKNWATVTLGSEPPSSELAKACGYLLNHWQALTRFLDDGRLGLDNNLCERQIRTIALGRKNYLFSGSHRAAEHAASLYSLMRTCALHDVGPLPYLIDVLQKLAHGWPDQRLDELLPDRWKAAEAPT